jgi:hypothetical protein
MAAQSHSKPAPDLLPRRPTLRVIESTKPAQLHLFTYVVGNAMFWTLWGAICVSADRWHWWPILPFAGWALVLSAYLWHAHRHRSGRREYAWRGGRS